MEPTISILKQAILLERKGKVFYARIAEQAVHPPIREFFEAMAEEEDRHEEILSHQYRAFLSREKFDDIPLPAGSESQTASRILTPEVIERIASAGFEAAAISAAMNLEASAVRIYSERAAAATDPQEKVLYQWLSDWEKGHLDILSRLDRALTEAIWNDNSFWPF